ncbi:MAG: anion permease [Polyangiales bacterium]|nr:inorganic phosphate transporter [Myxococcales bacterium]MCB9657162.1 inorganic phosphate transporter [Sandaracinaceae bacterium]
MSAMVDTLTLTVVATGLVLAFEFTNGFHDASNMVATMIASRAMRPGSALALVAAATVFGPLLGGVAVANTVAGVVDLSGMDAHGALLVIVCGLVGAIGWNVCTWTLGVPSSSSFALFGALSGAALHAGGLGRVNWGFAAIQEGHLEGLAEILCALLLSPVLGFALGALAMTVSRRMLASAHPRVMRRLRHAQWVTSSGLAFAHGTNDAQKGMGIIALTLLLGGEQASLTVPTWVILLCAVTISIGTLTGGWRIIRTLGFGIYRIRPEHALDSQLASSLVIFAAGQLGAPVSTTHVVTTSIMGVGAAEHPRRVRWSRAREIVVTWFSTLPASALVGGAVHALLSRVI